MRAREFIFNEAKHGKFDQSYTDSMTHVYKFPQMGNTYEIYRFGVSLAGSPEPHPDYVTHGAVGEVPWIVAYTDGEEEIIKHSLKLHGASSKPINKNKSKEHASVHTASPVATKKKNRYGV
jgi:hypothetical protein